MSGSRAAASRALVALLPLLLPVWVAAADPAAPVDGEPWALPPGSVLAELPFLGDPQDPRIFVDLAPEQSARPLRLQLDTGATDTLLTPGMARALGVRVRRLKDTPYRRRTRLGRDLLFRVDASLGDLRSPAGWDYGLLGGAFLSRYVVELDFDGRRLRLIDPRRFRVPAEGAGPEETVLPLRLVANRPQLELQLAGRPARALLDTGAPFPLVLKAPAARRLGLPLDRLLGLRVFGGRGEMGEPRLAEAAVSLGALSLGSVPALVTASFFNQGGATDALLGAELLAQLRVRIDYPRRRLWLRRRAAQPLRFGGAPWEWLRRSGALWLRGDGSCQVEAVREGGRAWRVGLRPGDVVVGIGEETGSSPGVVVEALDAGRPLRVRRGDGADAPELRLPPRSP